MNSVNRDTLDTLLHMELRRKNSTPQTEILTPKIASKKFSIQKNRLKMLFHSDQNFFPLKNLNTSYVERFRSKLAGEIRRSYQTEEDEGLLIIEGGIERGLVKGKERVWGEDQEEKERMRDIMKKYHKRNINKV